MEVRAGGTSVQAWFPVFGPKISRARKSKDFLSPMRKIFSSPVFQTKIFESLSLCTKAAPVNVRIPVVFNNYLLEFWYNDMEMKNHNFGKRKKMPMPLAKFPQRISTSQYQNSFGRTMLAGAKKSEVNRYFWLLINWVKIPFGKMGKKEPLRPQRFQILKI
jgi:hypothetical protein